MNVRSWYRFENKVSDPAVAEIHIIDFIGGWTQDLVNRFWGEQVGVTARQFVEDLKAIPEAVTTLNVHINSPGGDVQAGINIANALREQVSKGRTVHTFIDGLAASIASVIAMAGQKVHIADNALMMLHDPWSVAIGDAAELRKTADVLDTMRTQIVATYRWHSTKSAEDLQALMAEESWLDADEAIAAGLATDKIEGLQAAASIDPKAMVTITVPDKYRDRVKAFLKPTDAPPPPQEPAAAADVLRECKAAGCLDLAEEFVTAGATLAQVQARVTDEKAARDAETQRTQSIRTLCANAKLPELADEYIAGRMPVAKVQAQLTTLTAKLDGIEIDAGLSPEQKTQQVQSGWKNALKRAGVLAGARG